jgi:hypothetical protein
MVGSDTSELRSRPGSFLFPAPKGGTPDQDKDSATAPRAMLSNAMAGAGTGVLMSGMFFL